MLNDNNFNTINFILLTVDMSFVHNPLSTYHHRCVATVMHVIVIIKTTVTEKHRML